MTKHDHSESAAKHEAAAKMIREQGKSPAADRLARLHEILAAQNRKAIKP